MRKGLTTIEIIIAIAVIFILVGIILPQGIQMREKAKIAKARLQMHKIAQALESFRIEEGEYPTTLADLSKEDHMGIKKYFTDVPLNDPWGNPYFYDAWECDGTIYASPTLQRHTPPKWETFYFSATPGEYTMILRISHVSSARVVVNGEEIFHPNDFNANVTLLQRNLQLQTYNTLEVRITSNPNATMDIEIVSPLPDISLSDDTLPPLEYAEKGYNWSPIYGIKYVPGFLLGSYGQDGEPGGEKFAKDLIYGKVE